MRTLLRRLLLAGLLAAPACTKAPSSKPCPEARATECMTRVDCSYDAKRDCEVCRCAPPTQEPIRSSK
ncbi:MAG: hypothetical protein U0263_30470 [Polyangiaceae bacterium]